MKKLLIVLAALMIPSIVFAGNVAPRVYLEVYRFEEDPTDPGPVPGYVCVHQQPTVYPWTLPCYEARLPYNFYVVPIHIGSLDTPTCPVPGTACAEPLPNGQGGYLGIFFGVASTGTGTLTFMSWNACDGFLKGPSAAGEPAACGASSTRDCHDWMDHEGYLIYMNLTSTAARYLNVTTNADLLHTRVINCHNQYDMGTVFGGNPGGVQIGGAQTILCGESPTPVNATTWGAIKGLYR
jgi:hypothetical protein